MAIDDATYLAWLQNTGRQRCVLVEMDVYSGGATTRYLSTLPFVSTAADTPASTAYEDIVLKVPEYRVQMSEFLNGRSVVSWGDVDIDNSAGVRDTWLDDIVDGRPIRMYLGDPSWPKSDFRSLLVGTMRDIKARDWRTLSISMRDKQLLFSKPLRSTLITGTSSQLDMRAPVCYGEVKNITPVLIDGATRRYKVHDGQINSIDAVYTDGVSGTARTDDLPNGEFTLTAAPTGRITCDVKGSKTGGTYVSTTGDIMARILSERAGLSGGEIGSVTALNTDFPGAVGYYAGADESVTIMQALDDLAVGAGAYYGLDRSGVVQFGQVKVASGTAALSLTTDDIEQRGIKLLRRIIPSKSVRLGYARNWSPTYDAGASSLTAAARESLAQAYKIAKATISLPNNLLAEDENTAATLLVGATDAQTEATRRATLWGTPRKVFEIAGFLTPLKVALNDVVSLDLGRFGLTGGALGRVVGFRESATDFRCTLEVFV